MTITEKYEQLDRESPTRQTEARQTKARQTANRCHAKHRRLDRVTQIHRVAKPDDPTARQAIRDIASKLAKLDHPLVPHVIDFLEDDTDYHLVLEAVKPAPTLENNHPRDVLDHLAVLEEATDALRHAAQRGIAHGDFSAASIGVDGQGIIEAPGEHKLDGLGIRQLHAPAQSCEEMSADDLAKIKVEVRQVLNQYVSSDLPTSKEPGEQTEEENKQSTHERAQQQAMKALSQRVSKTPDGIDEFSVDFRKWLNRELSIREARKLAFADPVNETKNVGGNHLPLILACVGVGVLIGGLLGYLFWPSSLTRDDQIVAINDGPKVSEPSTELTKEPAQPNVTSDLRNVGTLNNLDEAPADTDATNSVASNDANSDANAESPASPATAPATDPQDVDKESPTPNDPEMTSPAAETTAGTDEPDPPEPGTEPRSTSPFKTAATSADLPKTNSAEAFTLLTTDLTSEEELSLALYTDDKTSRQVKLQLEEEPGKQRWTVQLTRRRSETNKIASIARSESNVEFRWSPVANETSSVNQLRNTVLEIRSGKWTHELPLRTPASRPAVSFNLERTKPYTIDIDHPPSEMFLEFVPSDDSLAVASPTVIPWKESAMFIGLDAGKDSLVTLQLKPQSRTKLRATGYFRQTTIARRQPMKPGFARSLRKNMLAMNQNLFGMKAGVKNIKGKDAGKRKEQVQQRIKLLEEQKRIAEAFQEAYAAAVRTKLHLRVYCQPGGRKLLLADYGGQSDSGPDDDETQ